MKRLQLNISIMLTVCVVYLSVYMAVQWSSARTASAMAHSPMTIIVDAGHGGEDSGALSASGVRESDINLFVALKLEQVLALCGMRPYMIRSEDVSVHSTGDTIRERKISDLNNRVQKIETTENAILVSIHQNHFSESRYSGAQVFYAHTNHSKELALLTQKSLKAALNTANRREIKKAESVYIMKKIGCPGILIECGFLSNPEENRLLQDQYYQTKLSCAISCALAQFLEKGVKEVEI